MHQKVKTRDFRVTVGDLSPDSENCREIAYRLLMTDETGATIEREERGSVFEGMLGDPDQLPWLIAHTLRRLLTGENSGR